MAIASGVNKTVAIAPETNWGEKPAAGTATFLRRVSCDLNLSRTQFATAEITTTAQTASSRSGTDEVSGTLSGEASAKSFDMIWEQLLRGSFTNGVVLAASNKIAANAATGVLTLSAGSWITNGIKVGDTISMTGWAAPATANNRTYTVMSLTATTLKVDRALVTKAEGDNVVVSVVGKKLTIPLTVAGRSDKSFSVEETHSDTGDSYLFTGVKVGSASVSIQPDGMMGVEFSMMGKDAVRSDTPYFTSPAAPTTTSSMSSNSGAIFIDGEQFAVVTDFSFEVTGNMETGKVVFNELPDGTRPSAGIFLGRIGASGSVTTYMLDGTLFDKARSEQAISVVLRADGDDGTSIVYKFPKCKITIPQRSDGETGGTTQSFEFTALLPDGLNPAIEQSTMVIQSIYA